MYNGNRKGFTLIELLAVIIILGLLMAIAIPSVTKYIDQSRKNTLVSTINNYISAAVTGMNNGDYTFGDSVSLYDRNTLYFVELDCIALEKGGSNPYGEWRDGSAVVIQYIENQGYTYGFQFADESNHFMPRTVQSLIDKEIIDQGSGGASGPATTVTGGFNGATFTAAAVKTCS